MQTRFHRYSFGNVLLILAQREGATRVAGFNAWKRLGRNVCKGEKAIRILAPMIYKTTDEHGDVDPTIRGFKWVPVFDLARQTGTS